MLSFESLIPVCHILDISVSSNGIPNKGRYYYTTSIFFKYITLFLVYIKEYICCIQTCILYDSKYRIFHFGSAVKFCRLMKIISLQNYIVIIVIIVNFLSQKSGSPTHKGERPLREILTFVCIWVFSWVLWTFFFYLMMQSQTFFYIYVKLWQAVHLLNIWNMVSCLKLQATYGDA